MEDEQKEKRVEPTKKHVKRIRRRKKLLYNSICKQMEFYFGDANLSKDRYLKKLVDENPFVPLEVFLRFNKMKELGATVESIAKSLNNSTLLKLNENQTCVSRIKPIPDDYCSDDRTIYVEGLPQNVNHEWITKLFNRYGTVVYVSLPTYKISKKIKGFAFVEFQNVESVGKTIIALKGYNMPEFTGTVSPSKLMSIVTFQKEQEEIQNENQEINIINDIEIKSDQDTLIKIDEEQQKNSEKENSSSENDCSSNLIKNDDSNETKSKTKKKRKQYKKKTPVIQVTPNELQQLKVYAKKDWKILRNKYLNMQRQYFSEMKKKLREENHKKQKFNLCTIDDVDEKKDLNEPVIKSIEVVEKSPLFQIEKGILLKIILDEPCTFVTELKDKMKKNKCVQYVDIQEGMQEVYIRCDNPSNTINLNEKLRIKGYKCYILKGDEETEYVKKINKDRAAKLSKEFKRKKRSNKKLVNAVKHHFYFDDENSMQ